MAATTPRPALTCAEVAAALRLAPKTVRAYIWSGRLAATKLGHRTIRIDPDALAAVRAASAVEPPAPAPTPEPRPRPPWLPEGPNPLTGLPFGQEAEFVRRFADGGRPHCSQLPARRPRPGRDHRTFAYADGRGRSASGF